VSRGDLKLITSGYKSLDLLVEGSFLTFIAGMDVGLRITFCIRGFIIRDPAETKIFG
jgi:hypothetical protein